MGYKKWGREITKESPERHILTVFRKFQRPRFMKGPVYNLWEVPCRKPSKLRPAILNGLDQLPLLRCLGLTDPLPPERLVGLVQTAIRLGAINGFTARMPHNGAKVQLVDLATLRHEWNELMVAIEKGRLLMNPEVVGKLVAQPWRSAANGKQALANFFRPFTERLLGNRWFLAWAERLCAARPAWLLALTSISPFPASQIRDEIVPLFTLIQRRRPRHILEIGTYLGGNLFLLSHMAEPTAILATMDLKIPCRGLLGKLGRHKQSVILIEGDSAAPQSVKKAHDIFPQGLDVLFIDGDHSYDGARRDFDNYTPLVKEGGLVILHDIVEDNNSRFGVDTGGWSGGVPRLWQELKRKFNHQEFIRNPIQDGAGIGVLFKEGN